MITNKANKILFIISFLAFSKLNSQSFKYFNFTFEFDSIIQYGSDQKYYIKDNKCVLQKYLGGNSFGIKSPLGFIKGEVADSIYAFKRNNAFYITMHKSHKIETILISTIDSSITTFVYNSNFELLESGQYQNLDNNKLLCNYYDLTKFGYWYKYLNGIKNDSINYTLKVFNNDLSNDSIKEKLRLKADSLLYKTFNKEFLENYIVYIPQKSINDEGNNFTKYNFLGKMMPFSFYTFNYAILFENRLYPCIKIRVDNKGKLLGRENKSININSEPYVSGFDFSKKSKFNISLLGIKEILKKYNYTFNSINNLRFEFQSEHGEFDKLFLIVKEIEPLANYQVKIKNVYIDPWTGKVENNNETIISESSEEKIQINIPSVFEGYR